MIDWTKMVNYGNHNDKIKPDTIIEIKIQDNAMILPAA
jgi:hypothetical protein